MNRVAVFLIGFISLFSLTATAQEFENIEQASASVNLILAESPTSIALTILQNGETVRKDEYDVIYEFNLSDVEIIRYEDKGYGHFVSMTCSSGNSCFFSERNLGKGNVHYLEVNSKEDANKVVSALQFIKANVSIY